MEFENTPRVWMFFGVIDGIWVLLPIAIFGTIVNGFLVSQDFGVGGKRRILQNCKYAPFLKLEFYSAPFSTL